MSDVFWQNLPLLIAAIGVAVPGIIGAVYAKRSVRITEEGNKAVEQAVTVATQEIKDRVRSNDAVIDTLTTGAFRKGHVAGVDAERNRSQSDAAPLGRE